MGRTPRSWPVSRVAGLLATVAAIAAASPVTALAATQPALGTTSSFAILAGSGITITGAGSKVSGDVGLSPGSALVGFPPGTLAGARHVDDAVAVNAKKDLVTAYNSAAGQPFTRDLTGKDLGGMTLTAGVYRFSSSAQLTGTLTLNGQGNPNAVFIFQIGSTLTTASAARVALINSAQPCGVTWQVTSSATLGSATAFQGNLLALTSITVVSGANIQNGRALARNGAVTIDTSVITAPPATCTIATVPSAGSTRQGSPNSTTATGSNGGTAGGSPGTPGTPNTGGSSRGTPLPWILILVGALVAGLAVRGRRVGRA